MMREINQIALKKFPELVSILGQSRKLSWVEGKKKRGVGKKLLVLTIYSQIKKKKCVCVDRAVSFYPRQL